MTKSKHTPGPWEAKCRDVTYKGGEWPRDQFLQWEVYGPDEPSGRGSFFQADARLIAAAPDLLEAAQEALALLRKGANGWGVSKDILAAAIAKATQE